MATLAVAVDGVCDWASATPCTVRPAGSRLAVVGADGTPRATGDAWRAARRLFYVRGGDGAVVAVRCATDADGDAVGGLVDGLAGKDEFERKTDAGSALMYFHYYGMLQHQQNMLQDYVRTGTYWAAIHDNAADFAGKTVVDVGAGSGILSLFAAQAGAARVYAVETSAMADHAERLCAANPGPGARVTVVRARVESAPLPARCADVLVSEPMGTLMLNERMVESYVYARDTLLKPGGRMFPAIGRIHVAAFSDAALHAELAAKADFWQQANFYGVDLTCLQAPALDGYFQQVVVDAVDAHCLVSGPETRVIDFGSVTAAELQRVVIPLRLLIAGECDVHGVAAWFDVMFDGSGGQRWLSTAPGLPTTHWFQLRCVMRQPLRAPAGAIVTGELVMEAHDRQSYWVHVKLALPATGDAPAAEQAATFDLKEPYYRQLTSWVGWGQAAAPDGGGGGGGDAV